MTCTGQHAACCCLWAALILLKLEQASTPLCEDMLDLWLVRRATSMSLTACCCLLEWQLPLLSVQLLAEVFVLYIDLAAR